MTARSERLTRAAWSADVRFYLDGVLDEISLALRHGQQDTADQLCALYVGLERDERVREALTITAAPTSGARSAEALAHRWSQLRARCRFPSARDVAAAKAELAAVPMLGARRPPPECCL